MIFLNIFNFFYFHKDNILSIYWHYWRPLVYTLVYGTMGGWIKHSICTLSRSVEVSISIWFVKMMAWCISSTRWCTMVRHQTLRNCSCTIPARASGGQCCDQRHLELLHDSLHSCTLELLVSKSQIPCDKRFISVQRKPPTSISRCSSI